MLVPEIFKPVAVDEVGLTAEGETEISLADLVHEFSINSLDGSFTVVFKNGQPHRIVIHTAQKQPNF